MTKNPSIDFLKGLLTLLVMGGHAMELVGRHDLLLWLGSGLRMPLMIGISGYLLNVTRIRTEAARALFQRYSTRLLLPWLFATILYLIISGWSVGWATPLDPILRPPFHLWYVPVLVFLIFVARLIPRSPLLLLVMGTPVSLATMYGFGLDHGPVGTSFFAPDSRFLRYPVYFFFGMLMAERAFPKRYLPVCLLLTLLGLWWWSGLYRDGHRLAYVPARLLMCLGLISLLPSLSALRLRFAPLNLIGQDSLFFYLWHPLIMGLLMAGGMHSFTMVIASVPLLFMVSRLAARAPFIGRILGAAPDRRVDHKAPGGPVALAGT
ncbi:acyltransferase [Sphingobium sp. AN558]|uniref:acyltransferase family protein n=1 Tax=Sphingobium sp. AN558 TaxID=3133442 RepID=UPI0030C1FD21